MEQHFKLYSPREIIELDRAGKRIFGAPMPLPHPKSRHSPPYDAMRGLIAENAVAGILNLLTLERDGLYVFHSVSETTPLKGETDHIVLYQKTLLLVETKNRSNFETVTLTKDGVLDAVRAGNHMEISSNHILHKINDYQERYPMLNVRGTVVFHHDANRLTTQARSCDLIKVTDLLGHVLHRVDASTQSGIDVLPFVKDIGVRCIRNEYYG